MIARFTGKFAAIWHAHRIDFIWTMLLGTLALLLRLPDFRLIPIFFDEGIEALWGWQITIGQHLPLTNADPYYGPVFPYLMALLFRLFGPHLFLARATMVGFGALTAVGAYWLGSRMFNRRAGVIAGLLTATAPYLIIFSHYGWSNSLTPFFTLLTLGVFYIGVKENRAILLALSGLLAALMLQTHPLTIVVIPGMLAWYLVRSDWRAQLRRPAAYAAIALFVLGYAPVILALLPSDIPMLRAAQSHSYAFEPTGDLQVYLQRLGLLVERVMLGAVGQITDEPGARTLTMLGATLFLLAGMGYAVRRRGGLLVSVTLATLLFLPAILRNYSFDLARYYVFLLPLFFIVVGAAAAEFAARIEGRLDARAFSTVQRALVMSTFTIIILLLACLPLIHLSQYATHEFATQETNLALLNFGNNLEATGACQNELWMQQVEPELIKRDKKAWFMYHSLIYFLTMHSCKFAVTNLERIKTRLDQVQANGWLLTLSGDESEYASSFRLAPVESIAPGTVITNEFVLYRVTPNKP